MGGAGEDLTGLAPSLRRRRVHWIRPGARLGQRAWTLWPQVPGPSPPAAYRPDSTATLGSLCPVSAKPIASVRDHVAGYPSAYSPPTHCPLWHLHALTLW